MNSVSKQSNKEKEDYLNGLTSSGDALNDTRALPEGLEDQDGDGGANAARLCRKAVKGWDVAHGKSNQKDRGCSPIATENRIPP